MSHKVSMQLSLARARGGLAASNCLSETQIDRVVFRGRIRTRAPAIRLTYRGLTWRSPMTRGCRFTTTGFPGPRGVYFIWFPGLSRRKSGILFGLEDDAKHITSVFARDVDPG